MNRLAQSFSQLKADNRKALATYIVAGDPQPEITLDAMHALVAGGADIIELGVPFSDPMAEGPVIQKAHERALEHNVSLKNTIEIVARFRETDPNTPVVLMGYANPVERMGYEAFAFAASKAGVDGVLTVDLPPEEAEEATDVFKQHGLEAIYLLAPTSSDERVARVSELASGFLYYVSLKGVTGAGHLDAASVKEKMAIIRQHCALPVMIGFGIKDAASTQAVAGLSEGVIVGSALVDIMGKGAGREDILSALGAKVREIRQALDSL